MEWSNHTICYNPRPHLFTDTFLVNNSWTIKHDMWHTHVFLKYDSPTISTLFMSCVYTKSVIKTPELFQWIRENTNRKVDLLPLWSFRTRRLLNSMVVRTLYCLSSKMIEHNHNSVLYLFRPLSTINSRSGIFNVPLTELFINDLWEVHGP